MVGVVEDEDDAEDWTDEETVHSDESDMPDFITSVPPVWDQLHSLIKGKAMSKQQKALLKRIDYQHLQLKISMDDLYELEDELHLETMERDRSYGSFRRLFFCHDGTNNIY